MTEPTTAESGPPPNSCRVVSVSSDSDYPQWEIAVRRFGPRSFPTITRPNPSDVPADVLTALRDWAERRLEGKTR